MKIPVRPSTQGINLALYLLALLVIAGVANYFAQRPEARLRIDATKTRAYSLSPQTVALLDGIDGRWTIAMIIVEGESDPATAQQVDEILRRYRDASPAIEVVRVDPTDPATLTEYEALIERLRNLEAERIAAYEAALDDGLRAFEGLRLFAQGQSVQLQQAMEVLADDDPQRAGVTQRLGLLGLLAQEGGQVVDAVAEARAVSETRPIPDYETARSILAATLSQWADELLAMAGIFDGWREQAGTNPVLARFAAGARQDYHRTAQRLAIASDPLAQLPPLELASIGRQLERGEAGIVIGPDRAAVIPAEQLFPKINQRDMGESAVAFDRRFRGEQVISAAIRSLLVETMPLVVFVHAGDRPLLRPDPRHTDAVGVAALLETSRFEVREWSVGRGERPRPDDGQPAVYIVVPPYTRQGLELDDRERGLLQATAALIADGEAVMLNVNPSPLPHYRQEDAWQAVAAPFGFKADTGRVILEAMPSGPDELEHVVTQTVQQFPHDHVICRAVNGQQTSFNLPVPITQLPSVPPDLRRDVLAVVRPAGRRWLEEDWYTALFRGGTVTPGAPLDGEVPIVVSAERNDPTGSGRQRFILVGSGGWLRSSVADIYYTMGGGGRAVLKNPGNQELLLAATSWLAGRDELIAPSPVSQQVARLDGLDRLAQILWGSIAVIATPIGCLALGGLVWFSRRLTS